MVNASNACVKHSKMDGDTHRNVEQSTTHTHVENIKHLGQARGFKPHVTLQIQETYSAY
jgi:hypothetical protein